MERLKKLNKIIGALVLSLGLALSYGFSAFAATPDADFLDVSHYNAEQGLPLSFYQTAKAGNVKGIVVKVSEGTYYVDPAASVNIANARQAGMVVSAYHFARYKSVDGAKNEADWFDKKLQLCGFSKTGDGYVVVDIEDNSLTTDKIALTAYTNAFINEMKRLGYSKVDVYSGSYYYNNRMQPSNLPSKPWLASYPSNPVQGQPTANFSNGTGAWQWTSNWQGMAGYGRFDASEDYAGKYTNAVKDSTPYVNTIGNISLVDYLKSKGMDASFAARSTLASQYGITDYTGSAAQNLAMLSKLQNGIQPAKLNIDNSKLNIDQPAPRPITSPAVSSNVKQPTSVSKSSTYTVRSGDSLSKIAAKYGMTVSQLASINGIKNKNLIRVGQVLKLTWTATVQSTASKTVYYTVKSGDVVSAIAKRYGSTSAQIKTWNKLNAKYTIYPGQKLRVR
jgi:LysM repeat protein/GH25 family lysozyme M1 (1,4-beta-N-acetylmuramidase)